MAAPVVLAYPLSLIVTENQNATFYCSADGHPKPSVSWSTTDGTKLITSPGRDIILLITNASYIDSRKYACTAKNDWATVQREVELIVEGKQIMGFRKKVCL